MGTVRRIIDSYDPAIRAALTIPLENVDDPAVVIPAAEAMPPEAAALLGSLWLVIPPGEKLPERMRPSIEKVGAPLWESALLLPRTSGSSVHPRHYAGACQLNPALQGWEPTWLVPPPLSPTPSFPPADARWDAVLVAARLETEPLSLTQQGVLRKDAERRLLEELGEPNRWALALAVARATGLVRVLGQRLMGFPEASMRPLPDPTALFTGPQAVACGVLLRLIGDTWWGVDELLSRLKIHARELLYSPKRDGLYQDFPTTSFDDAGWDAVEVPLVKGVLDTLHRVGVIDASRDASGVTAVRRAGAPKTAEQGFLLTPDYELLLPVGGLPPAEHARLARFAPYKEGEQVHRHRLTRAGVQADIDAGHGDLLSFLERFSRTGVPVNVREAVADWTRHAMRFLLLTGVEVVEDEQGRLRMATEATPNALVVDYGASAPGRFQVEGEKLFVEDGQLPVRAALSAVAELESREGLRHVYRARLAVHPDPDAVLSRLRQFSGGELPGSLEARVLAGSGLEPVQAVPALLVRFPATVVSALRRDPVAGPLMSRLVSSTEALVEEEELPRLKERLEELGLRWGG